MSKYSNFVIYKIYPLDDPTMCYIGSTTCFSRRKSQHKKSVSNKVSRKYYQPLYQYIRLLGGWDKMNMEIVEQYDCKTKEEGLIREKELIAQYKSKLNINNPIKNDLKK